MHVTESQRWIDIDTQIGNLKGFLHEDGKLRIENDIENRKLRGLIILDGDFQPLFSCLQNPDKILTVRAPDCCNGEWLHEGIDHSGGASVPPPLVFIRKL
ncbi:TPA: hypothetical protein RRF23_000033 [Klebsiella pneumoniae]|jgi:hypothetical protein|uniref:hypothetical protein n=1 Tax=Klebsiella variicola TaxID=244366 RepID=UPI0028CF8007|nr:hypothetical protein [Klebsiella variicola]HDY7342515.1 hypothetical protein [Klebsiella pneumoniae]